ncbi:hypothetical protein ANO11243_086740 [Dothideomycetidae sp. 11243]|nr:hypothetical protein ANO11243_086740 [fungal sp. No.11243]
MAAGLYSIVVSHRMSDIEIYSLRRNLLASWNEERCFAVGTLVLKRKGTTYIHDSTVTAFRRSWVWVPRMGRRLITSHLSLQGGFTLQKQVSAMV